MGSLVSESTTPSWAGSDPRSRLSHRLRRVFPWGLLLTCSVWAWGASSAVAQEPPKPAAATDWCALPLCRDAEGLRRQGDASGALKLYRYIQEDVDVDETVLRKPLLWFPIAALHAELRQPQQGLEALQKYQLYIASRPDSDLPPGQRREDVESLMQSLNLLRLRLASSADVEPPPAGLGSDGAASLAGGQPTLDPRVAAETERHIAAGLALSKQGLHRSARMEFDQAYELSHRPELLFHLAQVLLGQGQLHEAATYLKRYLEVAPQGAAHAEAEATLGHVQRELALEVEARRSTDAQQRSHPSNKQGLQQAGVALLSIGGGLLVTGAGLGIGAVVSARSLESAERYDPMREITGRGLQNAGIALDVLGVVSLGAGAACLGLARRHEAASPAPLRVTSAPLGFALH